MKRLMLTVKTPTRRGGAKGWNKLVVRVDTNTDDHSAFEGRLLDDQRVPLVIGSVIVSSIPRSFGHYPDSYWSVGIVTTDGMEWLPHLWDDSDFTSFRDYVAYLLPRASQMLN